MYNLTVLYAEDDPQSRKNYAFVLEEYFAKVYIAEDGKEALEIYYESQPDILLLDISMPLIDGLSVAKEVRKKNKDIPIIMLTAHSDRELLLRAINLKLEEYLVKPINESKLKEIILKVIVDIERKNHTISLRENLLWNRKKSHLLHKNQEIKLTKKEHQLLILLFLSFGEYYNHNALIISIWDHQIPDESHDNKLHQLVYRLNKKIKEITHSDIQLIENSYTLGYRVS